MSECTRTRERAKLGPPAPPETAGLSGIGVAAVLLVALFASTLALTPRTEAYVYWADSSGNGAIGRANPDGTRVDRRFITGVDYPGDVAVDDAHLYWTDPNGTLGRANLDGTGVDNNFITETGYTSGVAVDAAHVYWSNDRNIGRANLDGTGVDPNFITETGYASGVAVNATHVYWTTGLVNVLDGTVGTIGRANLDGTDVDRSFITGLEEPWGVAVDDAHVYWSNYETGRIGRASLVGTGVDNRFITGLWRGGWPPEGVAVDDAHVYWSYGFADIGRANLDGTGGDRRFIRVGSVGDAYGVAVDALPGFGKVKRNLKRGTAKLTLIVPGAGELKLAQTEKVKQAKERVKREGRVKLPIRPRRKAKQRLAAKGKSKVKARVTYTPDGGDPGTQTKRLKLIKRR